VVARLNSWPLADVLDVDTSGLQARGLAGITGRGELIDAIKKGNNASGHLEVLKTRNDHCCPASNTT
jgi:hypothetical protein